MAGARDGWLQSVHMTGTREGMAGCLPGDGGGYVKWKTQGKMTGSK